jgi:hypothetical protein
MKESDMFKKIVFVFLLLLSISSPLCARAKQKQFLYLGPVPYQAGFFSVFASVVGCLDQFERGSYAGLNIDFKREGLYYEDTFGPNWWTYYFEPISFGQSKHCQIIEGHYHQLAERTIYTLDVKRCAALTKKYVHVKPAVEKKVQDFINENFTADFILGIHFRGTDKYLESPRVPYEIMVCEINKVIAELNLQNYQLFVATDEMGFITYLEAMYPGKVIYTSAIRSATGNAIHVTSGNNHRKGEEAIVDCLLLSRCNYLLRTSSNLSLCSTFFNPNIPVKLLNPGVFDKH